VGKGGVVRNEEDQKAVLESLVFFFRKIGLSVLGPLNHRSKGQREQGIFCASAERELADLIAED